MTMGRTNGGRRLAYRVGYLRGGGESYAYVEIPALAYPTAALENEVRSDIMRKRRRANGEAAELTFVQFPLAWGAWHAMERYQENRNAIRWHTYRMIITDHHRL